MNYEEYKKAYFADPQPEPKFEFAGLYGFSLFIEEYEAAVAYYTLVLGPPAYVEGDFTKGWRIGEAWLTLFPSKSGAPRNADFQILMKTPAEAEKLQKAFIEAGGQGKAPSDDLMYEPLHFCNVRDPFGTNILIVSRVPWKEA